MLLKVCAQKIQKTKQTLELLKAIEIFEKIKKTVRVDNLKIRTFVNTHVNAQAKTKTLKKYIKFTLNDFFYADKFTLWSGKHFTIEKKIWLHGAWYFVSTMINIKQSKIHRSRPKNFINVRIWRNKSNHNKNCYCLSNRSKIKK